MVNNYQGPVRPGTDVSYFRRTGTVRTGRFHGPVRQGIDEEIFRRTGRSFKKGSAEALRIRREIEAKKQARIDREKREAETRRLAEEARLFRDKKTEEPITKRERFFKQPTAIFDVRDVPPPRGFVSPTGDVAFKQFFAGLLPTGKAFLRGEADIGEFFDPFRGKGEPKAFKELSDVDEELFKRLGGEFPSGTILGIGDTPKDEKITYKELETKKRIEEGVPIELAGLPSSVFPEVASEFLGGRIKKEEEKKVIAEFQPLIDVGKLTLEEAQIQANKKFQESVKIRYEKEGKELFGKFERAGGLGDLSVTSGDIIAGWGTRGIELGAYATAFTTPVTATMASAYLVGTSPKEFTTAFLGEDLTFSERALSGGMGGLKVGIGFLGAGAVFAQTPKSMLARQSQRELLKDLEKQTISLGGKELGLIEKGSVFRFSGSRIIEGGRASQEFDILAPVFRSKTGLPRIVGGRAFTETKIQDVISDIPLKFKEGFIVKGRLTGIGDISVVKDIGGIKQFRMLEDVTGGFGKGFIKKREAESFREFPLLGGAKREGDILKVLEIKPEKLVMQKVKGQAFFFGKKPSMVEYYKIKKVKGGLEGFGEIQLLPTTKDVSFISPAKIKKTPLEKTFRQIQIQEIAPVIPSFKKEILKETSKRISTTLRTDIKTMPSAFAGTGLYERTEGGLLPKLFAPTKMGDVLIQPTKEKFIQLQAPSLVTPLKQKETLGLFFRPKTEMRLGESFIPRQSLKPLQAQKLIQLQTQKFAPPMMIPTMRPRAFGFGRFTPFGFFPPIPFLGGEGVPKRKKGKRIFKRVPSLGAVMKWEMGIKVPKLSLKMEKTGLVERKYLGKKIKLDTTMIKGLKKFKMPKLKIPNFYI